MAQGKDFKLYISLDDSNTADGTNDVEVELQGDMTVNPGKTTNVTVYKNGQSSSQNLAGFTATLTMGNTAPMSAGEAKIWGLHDSGTTGYCWIRNSVTGGLEWAFPCKVAISSLSAGVNNPTDVSVNIAADGQEPARGVAA